MLTLTKDEVVSAIEALEYGIQVLNRDIEYMKDTLSEVELLKQLKLINDMTTSLTTLNALTFS